MNNQTTRKILFCNVAYLPKYDFDPPSHNPKSGSVWGEQINFHNFNGVNFGYVEVGFSNGKHYQIHIEKLEKGAKKKTDNVTVVFCARKDNKTVIVGWYKNATVYRNAQMINDYYYFFETDKENAVLLNQDERVQVIPRASETQAGFGQKNIWYAKQDGAHKIVNDIFDYIDNYA